MIEKQILVRNERMPKYIFSRYDNPALVLYVEEDYPLCDFDYVQRNMLVELTEAEYKSYLETENQYNAAVDFMDKKQEEYAELNTNTK
jgi:hypothetical protein